MITEKQQQEYLLTKRELEILNLITHGKSSKQIAEQLHISLNTVSNHRKNMLAKTGAKSSAEMIFMVIGYAK